MTLQRPPTDAVAVPPSGAGRPWYRLILPVLGRAAANFREDRGTQLAAAISYYGLFSLFPLTLLAVSVFGVVLRSERVKARVLDHLFTQLPLDPGQGSVQQALENAASLGPTLSVVSLLGAFWTAGALSAAIRSALNVIFDAPRNRPLVRGKAVDYMLLPIIGLPFLGGVFATTAWRIMQRNVEALPFVEGQVEWLWELGALLIPLGLSFIAFLLLYTLIPNRYVELRYAVPGALLAAVLFELLKVGFAIYLANFASYDVIYGPISSVIVLLFWVYVTANIMLFGAEVASEAPHVVHPVRRLGRASVMDEGGWRRSLWSFARGLVLAGDDSTTRAPAEAERPAEPAREQQGATAASDGTPPGDR